MAEKRESWQEGATGNSCGTIGGRRQTAAFAKAEEMICARRRVFRRSRAAMEVVKTGGEGSDVVKIVSSRVKEFYGTRRPGWRWRPLYSRCNHLLRRSAEATPGAA